MPERLQFLPLTSTSVGFIGDRGRLTSNQLVAVRFLLQGFGVVEVHHGDELGADEDIHRLADGLRAWRMVHPRCDGPDGAGFQRDVVFPPRPYPRSDHEIVDAAGAVILAPAVIFPDGDTSPRTVEALRYGRSKNRTIVVVTPTGKERWLRRR